MDGTAVNFFSADLLTWGGNLGPKIHPGWIFWTMIFYNLEKFNSRSEWVVKLYFEFTRSWSGHWVAQIQLFFGKLPEMTVLASDYNLRIGQDSEFAKFWPRALTM